MHHPQLWPLLQVLFSSFHEQRLCFFKEWISTSLYYLLDWYVFSTRLWVEWKASLSLMSSCQCGWLPVYSPLQSKDRCSESQLLKSRNFWSPRFKLNTTLVSTLFGPKQRKVAGPILFHRGIWPSETRCKPFWLVILLAVTLEHFQPIRRTFSVSYHVKLWDMPRQPRI